MDPLTHMVVGRAVVAAADRGDRPARGVAWAAILGALSPDIDIGVAFFGWDRYVRFHQIGTHAIAGAVAMACLTAAVVGAVVRLRGGATRFATLFGAAAAGALSHLILDLVCGGRIRLGWPLVSGRVTVPLVAMADPWLVAICIGGLLARWPGRRPMHVVSQAILAAAIVLLAVKAALLARALRSSPVAVSLPAIEASWGSWTEWSVFERGTGWVRAWTIGSGPPVLSMAQPLGRETPLERGSRSLPTVQNFLAAHDFVFPVDRPAGGGRRQVLWSDLHYCRTSTASGARVDSVDREAAQRAPIAGRGESVSCAVWAGGVFDVDGRALKQLVQVGSVVQTRPAPP
jgi:hypothetical protein